MSHHHTQGSDDPQTLRKEKSEGSGTNLSRHRLDPHNSHHHNHHTPTSNGSNKNLNDEEDDEYWGKPIRHSQDEDGTANQHINKGEASFVGSSTSYSSSALTNPQSPLLALRNSIFEFIVSFKRNESFITNKFKAVMWFILHCYMIYYSIITSSITTTESEESRGALWGTLGSWIWRVLHFPLNFGVQYYPYELIYTFSAICLFVEIVALVCFYAYRVGIKNGSRHNDKIKMVSRLLIIFVIVFSPFMLFVHTYPLVVDLNIFSSSSTDIYMEHFTTPLFTASANIGLVVIGGIGTLLTGAISVLGFYLVYETIPVRGTRALFVLDRIYPLCFLLLNNQIGIVLTVILTYELCVVAAAVKFLMSILFVALLFISIPFYRRWENCVYCGVGMARALGSLGPLICLIVTRDSNIDFELVGGIMTGITLALMILGFIIGYVIMEIYTRLKIRSIRRELQNYFEDSHSVSNIISELSTKKLNKSMVMFLKFNVLKTSGAEGSDLDLARKFIKAANLRSVTDVNLLIIAASFVGNTAANGTESGNIALAIEILRRVLKQNPNFIQIFHYFLRSKEVEANLENYASVSYEVKKLLERLDKKQAQILALHQDFFKELSSENPAEEKLEKINRKSNNLIIFCENAYKNCMYTNMNNKILLRAYAQFLETYRFELEVANELYEEANQIEEEKSKSSKQHVQQKSNRVVPYAEEPSTMKRRKSDSLKHGVSFDEVVDNWDSISARMEQSMKQDAFYRTSINTPEHRKSYYFTFLPFVSVSFLVLLILLTMSLVFSSEFTSRTVLEEKICSIAGGPSIMANHIRSIQARYRFLNESTTGTAHSLASIQANYVLSKINQVISASSDQFFPAVTEDFISQKWLYKVPNKQLVGESAQLYSTMNVSVLEFLQLFDNHANRAIFQLSNPSELNNTATNFPILFFLYNRETMSEAFEWFCTSFLDTSMARADLFNIIFWSTSAALLTIYFCLTGLYIAMLRQYFVQIKRTLIQVFRKIPKDEVGKIYHSLNSEKTNSNIEETVISPKVRILILTLFTFLVVALVAPIQIYEFQLNKQNHFSTMKTAASVNSVLTSVTSVNFKLTEMILRSNMSEYSWSVLHEMNKNELMEISSSWSYVTRGSPDLGYSNSLFGKYDDLDLLLDYTCDNTTFAPPSSNATNNSTSTSSTSTSSAGSAVSAVAGTVAAQLTCLGLEKLVHGFMTIASELNEDFYTSFYGKKYETSQYFMSLYYPTLGAVQLIYDFISTYVQATKYSQDYLTIASTVIGSVAVILLSWLSYLAMNDHFAENQSVRLLLNYVPKEVVDQVPDMVEYIVNYRLPSAASRVFKWLQRRDAMFDAAKSEDDSMAMTRSILNSAVDGSIVCNPKGEVFLFNPASEDMFAYKKVEILGVRLETLFASENSDRIAKVIDSMNTNNNSADTFEVTALRKNKTTFPALISLSISHYLGKPILSCFVKDITQVKKHASLLGEEKKKSEELLLNILPLPVANRLKQGETFIAEKFADVTIFFSDMVGFTKMSSGMEADQLVMMLNTIVNEFDKLTEKYLIDKIKTIGDAYFAVSGTHSSKSSDHPERMLKFSISVYSFLRDFNVKFGKEVNLRIGMHTGPCVGGVIGTKKFAYDLWGDTINTASRMESTGVPGRIQISRSTYERVFDLEYEFEERESIFVKGKGEMKTYLLKEKHHANPIPKIEEIEQSNSILENERLNLPVRPPVSRSGSSSDELTVLKINNTIDQIQAAESQ